MNKPLTYLILHCTATPENREVSSAEIKLWHTSPVNKGGRGWKQVGYSDLIHLDGQIENLVSYDNDQEVDAWEITNGASGINSISRHIVYAGGTDKQGKPKDTRTSAQTASMLKYCMVMIRNHPQIKIAGHNQFAAKACPSFDVPAWLRSNGVPEKNIYTK
jgi:N-acetylmuramoyl-L-alanine amidase